MEGRNIKEWISIIGDHPRLYVKTIQELEVMLHGYQLALKTHNIVEDTGINFDHFPNWLSIVHNISPVSGWAKAIFANCGHDEDLALQDFLQYSKEFFRTSIKEEVKIEILSHNDSSLGKNKSLSINSMQPYGLYYCVYRECDNSVVNCKRIYRSIDTLINSLINNFDVVDSKLLKIADRACEVPVLLRERKVVM